MLNVSNETEVIKCKVIDEEMKNISEEKLMRKRRK